MGIHDPHDHPKFKLSSLALWQQNACRFIGVQEANSGQLERLVSVDPSREAN